MSEDSMIFRKHVVCTTVLNSPTTNTCCMRMKLRVLFTGNSFHLQTEDSQYFFWNICSKWLYQTKQNLYWHKLSLSSLPLPPVITAAELRETCGI